MEKIVYHGSQNGNMVEEKLNSPKQNNKNRKV